MKSILDNPLLYKSLSTLPVGNTLPISSQTPESSIIREADPAALYSILDGYAESSFVGQGVELAIEYRTVNKDPLSNAFDALNSWFDVCMDVMYSNVDVYGSSVFDAYKTRLDAIDEKIYPVRAYVSPVGLSVFTMLSQHKWWKAKYPKAGDRIGANMPSGYIMLEDTARIQKPWREAYLGSVSVTLCFPDWSLCVKNDPQAIQCLKDVADWCKTHLQYRQYGITLLQDAHFMESIGESV
jgi:hypothetical protein